MNPKEMQLRLELLQRLNVPKSFTVIRSQWVRGEMKLRTSKLLTKDGKRCCVGFLAKAMGIPDEVLLDNGYLRDAIRGSLNGREFCSLLEAERIYFTNDAEEYCFGTDFDREVALHALFKNIGITVEFVDEYTEEIQGHPI